MPERRDVLTGFSLCLPALNSKEMALHRPMQLNDLLWLWSSGKDFHFPSNHLTFKGITKSAWSKKKFTEILQKERKKKGSDYISEIVLLQLHLQPGNKAESFASILSHEASPNSYIRLESGDGHSSSVYFTTSFLLI